MKSNISESIIQIGKLIEAIPEEFKKTTIIGIFDSKDICSSFIHYGHLLERQDWWEDFSFANRWPKKERKFQINQRKNLYKDIMEDCPNINFYYEDGSKFFGNNNFLFIDTEHNSLYEFYKQHKEKIGNTWFAFCGFGRHVQRTYEIMKIINNYQVLPVAVIYDNIFLSPKEQHAYYIEKIKQKYKLPFRVTHFNNKEYIDLQSTGYWTH
jgi:hypothetical protein